MRSIAMLALGTTLLAGCGGAHGAGDDARTVTIEGSDTMAVLAAQWAHAYMAAHPEVTVVVSAGGTGTGISALAHGTASIADASRVPTDDERRLILSSRGAEPVVHRVALDALGVYVNEASPMRSLTLAQLGAVLRGDVQRWSDVGGGDGPIVLYGRDGGSGTRAWLGAHVLGGAPFSRSVQALPGTAAVVDAVARDVHGLGYGGIAYGRGVRALAVVDAAGVARLPTRDDAESGAYPLARPLFLVTAGAPRGANADFLRWVTSPAGQALVEAAGYYPLEARASR